MRWLYSKKIITGGSFLKYKNAKDVLPEHLLSEIQKYIDGDLIYVPKLAERAKWGSHTGLREEIKNRNIEITDLYRNGRTMEDIAREYFLSIESIKKILNKNAKQNLLVYK